MKLSIQPELKSLLKGEKTLVIADSTQFTHHSVYWQHSFFLFVLNLCFYFAEVVLFLSQLGESSAVESQQTKAEDLKKRIEDLCFEPVEEGLLFIYHSISE